MSETNIRTSTAGLLMLAALEGLRLRAYRDKDAGVLTIGFGHTREVHRGEEIGVREAHELLVEDVARAEAELLPLLEGREVTGGQWDALVSLVFNVGGAALADSRLMRKLRAGDVDGAAAEFALWNKARNPKTKRLAVSSILSARRAMERALFEAGL